MGEIWEICQSRTSKDIQAWYKASSKSAKAFSKSSKSSKTSNSAIYLPGPNYNPLPKSAKSYTIPSQPSVFNFVEYSYNPSSKSGKANSKSSKSSKSSKKRLYYREELVAPIISRIEKMKTDLLNNACATSCHHQLTWVVASFAIYLLGHFGHS